jgi:hypothetical protein
MPINRFSIEQQLIRIELNQILDASELMESTIRKHLNEIDSQRIVIEEQWSDEDRAAYEDKLAHDVFQIRDVFAQVLRRSLFISAYAYLEQGLDTICTRLQQERGFTVSLTDINGRGITRSKNLFEQGGRYHLPGPRSNVDACEGVRRSAELFDSQRAFT